MRRAQIGNDLLRKSALAQRIPQAEFYFKTNGRDFSPIGNSKVLKESEEEKLLKIRVMGTTRNLKWFRKYLERDKRLKPTVHWWGRCLNVAKSFKDKIKITGYRRWYCFTITCTLILCLSS